MKKIIVFLCVIFFITACEKKIDDPEKKEPVINISKDKKKLKLFVEDEKERKLFVNLAERFENEEYSITVLEDTGGDIDDIDADLIFYNPNNYNIDDLINKNLIKPLNLENKSYPDNFTKSLISKDGKIFYIPVSANAFGIIVNKDKIGNNLEALKYPISWEDMQKICNNLKSYAFSIYKAPEEKLNFMAVSLISSIIKNGTKIAQTDIEKAAEIYEIINKFSDKNQLDFDYEQALNEFANGRAAMVFGSNEDLLNLIYIEPNLNLEFVPIPQISDEYNSIVLDFNRAFSIKGDGDSQKFIDFFLESENLNYYINSYTYFSMINTAKSDIKEYGNFNNDIFSYGYTLNLFNRISDENKSKITEMIND